VIAVAMLAVGALGVFFLSVYGDKGPPEIASDKHTLQL